MKKVLVYALNYSDEVADMVASIASNGADVDIVLKQNSIFISDLDKYEMVCDVDMLCVYLSSIEDYLLLGIANTAQKRTVVVMDDDEVPQTVQDAEYVTAVYDNKTAMSLIEEEIRSNDSL